MPPTIHAKADGDDSNDDNDNDNEDDNDNNNKTNKIIVITAVFFMSMLCERFVLALLGTAYGTVIPPRLKHKLQTGRNNVELSCLWPLTLYILRKL